MKSLLSGLVWDDQGQDLIEYSADWVARVNRRVALARTRSARQPEHLVQRPWRLGRRYGTSGPTKIP